MFNPIKTAYLRNKELTFTDILPDAKQVWAIAPEGWYLVISLSLVPGTKLGLASCWNIPTYWPKEVSSVTGPTPDYTQRREGFSRSLHKAEKMVTSSRDGSLKVAVTLGTWTWTMLKPNFHKLLEHKQFSVDILISVVCSDLEIQWKENEMCVGRKMWKQEGKN